LTFGENNMYAIIRDGDRQLRVEPGQEVDVDFRGQEPGEAVTFDRVLAVRDEGGFHVGRPLLPSARVTAEIVSDVKGPKLVVQKFRRRKNMRRRNSAREDSTRVKITGISLG
jgi:large subunit ribosomal protein L21